MTALRRTTAAGRGAVPMPATGPDATLAAMWLDPALAIVLRGDT